MTGVIPVDKPAGPTSHDVVATARRALRIRRIGHTGTLDPFATGLLLLCVGAATRLAEYLTDLDKVYEATARLGVATDTLDGTGAVLSETGSWTELGTGRIRTAFEDQAGTRLQRPPAYSAKRLGGRRAYELARAGEAVQPEPVEVTIHTLEVTGIDGPDVSFRLRASSGTYVRSVARDAGEALGTGAHLTALRRTRVGGFDVEGALTPDRLEDEAAVRHALIPPAGALAHLPVVVVSEEERGRVAHGQRVRPAAPAPDGVVAVTCDDALVAVAESEGGLIRPRKVFAS